MGGRTTIPKWVIETEEAGHHSKSEMEQEISENQRWLSSS